MNPSILKLLCDPDTKKPLELINPSYDTNGRVVSGELKSPTGKTFLIHRGVPRFVPFESKDATVESFGDQWNFFNYDKYKKFWVDSMKNTFGSLNIFKDQLVIDAGAGSGMSCVWMLENGAKHVIALELSHCVDGVLIENLEKSGFKNWDIIQCTIDQLPLLPNSIDGMVYCHNVIQHTPSVEKTARSLFEIAKPGSEFVFNCYDKNEKGLFRKFRWRWHFALRDFLVKRSFKFRLNYSKIMGVLQFVPVLGFVLGKTWTLADTRKSVPHGKGYFKRPDYELVAQLFFIIAS